MLILGLSSSKHDTAAALFEDGVIKAAIENDKLVRSRAGGVPEEAIRFCLEQAGADWNDLDAIAMAPPVYQNTNSLPDFMRAKAFRQTDRTPLFASESVEANRTRSEEDSASTKFHHFDHQLCHAASSFYLSPFDRALIVTMDEEGDGNCGMIAVGEGSQIRVVNKIRFPNSLAWIYSRVTSLLGFEPHQDEHKTQWLSIEGEPVFKSIFLEMFKNRRNHLPALNSDFTSSPDHAAFSDRFYREIRCEAGTKPLPDDTRRALASSLQQACVEVVGSLVEYFRKREGVQKVCLAGGLFQNALLVAMLEKRLGINEVFVPPAPGNAGCALGAGLLVWHSSLGNPRLPAVSEVYSGPTCQRSEIKDVLDNCKARYSIQTTIDRKMEAALQLLDAGKIVGWFQGPTEFGPRALGNRSLLASPWAPYVRDNLNDYIKHREWFRPFALAVPEEVCDRYFDCSQLCQSMNSLAWARPQAQTLLDGFVLPGGLVRLQVVRQKSNPQFWLLLQRFGERAPAPLLVNTSFNLFGEPLVAKPRDAVRSYFCSGVDALMIDMFLLSKSAANHVSLVPRAS